MSHQINRPPPAEARKWPPGLGVVVTVGAVALAGGFSLNHWLGENVGNPGVWYAATAGIAVLTICLAAIDIYRDREEADYDKYIENLRAIVRITHRYKKTDKKIATK